LHYSSLLSKITQKTSGYYGFMKEKIRTNGKLSSLFEHWGESFSGKTDCVRKKGSGMQVQKKESPCRKWQGLSFF